MTITTTNLRTGEERRVYIGDLTPTQAVRSHLTLKTEGTSTLGSTLTGTATW